MLTLRQIIPPLTAQTAAGEIVRAWDYKQKKSLLIAFLHADCVRCKEFLAAVALHAPDLTELESVALVVFLGEPPQGVPAPPPVVLASETNGRAAREYLGADAFGPLGLSRVGLFVTDRYGELFAQWEARDAETLPAIDEALKWLAQTQRGC
jgi:peroxiredoxin